LKFDKINKLANYKIIFQTLVDLRFYTFLDLVLISTSNASISVQWKVFYDLLGEILCNEI